MTAKSGCKRVTDMLQIGDILDQPIYGQPRGAAAPVLLLAAGQQIETVRQLRQLREAGFSVRLPGEVAAPPSRPAVSDPEDAPELSPEAPFAQRIAAAQRLRQTVTQA